MPRDHQRGQQALASLVRAPVRAAWEQLVDVQDLSGTLPPFKAATAAVVSRYGQASGAAALQHYRTQRLRAGVPGRPTLTIAAPAPYERVESSIGWATRELWTPSLTSTLVDSALTMIFASTERMVLDQGRDTILEAVRTDRAATGYARVPEGEPCAFCAMLCTAGQHYLTEESASFEAHDHCACQPEPVFNDQYTPAPEVQAWSELYADSTRGFHGEDAVNAFRRAYERPGDEQDQ